MMRSVLLTALTLAVLSAQPKVFVDSQGNHWEIDQSAAGKISFSCPGCAFETTERVYDVGVQVKGESFDGKTFEGKMPMKDGAVLFDGSLNPAGLFRIKVTIPGVDKPFDLALMPFEAVPPAKGEKLKPDHLVVKVIKPSAVIGKWAPLEMYLVDAEGKVITPDKDVLIQIDVENGAAIPSLARLTKDSPKVPAGISPNAKLAKAKLTTPGVPAASAQAIGCSDTPASELVLKLNAERDRAYADGRDSIPVIVALVDSNDTPATDGNPKEIGLDISGVGRILASGDMIKSATIAAGQCAELREIVSDTAGTTKVSAEFRARHLEKSLAFRPALNLATLLLTLGGGLVGGFVAAGRNYAKVRRWQFLRWVFWLIAAMAGAVATYLAYFYGLLQVAGGLPSGSAFGFLTGILGGYLGAEAISRLVGAQPERQPNTLLN